MVGYFVHIPKCAGSSVERYLYRVCESIGFLDTSFLTHAQETVWNKSSPQHIDGLSLSRLFRNNNFFDFTFAIVRHPYTRFISAFKFQRDREKKIDPQVKLEDLIKQIVSRGIDSAGLGWMDNHFLPMTYFLPLSAKVRVFKFERGLQPFHRWFETKILAKPSGVAISHINKGLREPTISSSYVLSHRAKTMLYEIYKCDFEKFGYAP